MTSIRMEFPETWEEYEQEYGFNDTEEIYTYNSRLIPSFRVKQWLDHLSSIQPKTGHWTERKMHKGTGFFLPTCSECGNIQPYTHHTFRWNYCPSCGAKMQEVEE